MYCDCLESNCNVSSVDDKQHSITNLKCNDIDYMYNECIELIINEY